MAIADRLRFVRFRDGGQVQVLLDVADNTTYTIKRDELTFQAPNRKRVEVAYQRRYGGRRTVGEQHDNGIITCAWFVAGASNDLALNAASALLQMFEAPLAAPALLLEWRPSGATKSIYFEVRGCADWDPQYSWITFSARPTLEFKVSIVVSPLAYGDPYDIYDPFEYDTIGAGDWTADSGGANVSIIGGQLVSPTSATIRLRYTGRSYPYGDARVSCRINTSAATSALACGPALCMDTAGADTMLHARIVGSSGSPASTLQVCKVVAGTVTVLASTALAPAANWQYVVAVRREGLTIYAEAYQGSNNFGMNEPGLFGDTILASTNYTLTPAEAQQFTLGHSGIRWVTPGNAETIDTFRCLPFTYQGRTTPEQPHMYGPVYGDAPALVDTWVAQNPPSIAGSWGIASYIRRAQIFNRVRNGDLELGNTAGWLTSGAAGVSANATLSLQSADGKFGSNSLQVVTTGVGTAQGVTSKLAGRIKKGQTVTATAWVKITAGTTPVLLLRLSNLSASDKADSNQITAAAGWTLVSVTWTPTADYDLAYVALVASPSVANAITFRADAITVSTARQATLSGAMTNVQTTLPVTKAPIDWPAGADTPYFDAVIAPGTASAELVRVATSSAPAADTAGSYTITRGSQLSTAVAHSSGDVVVPLPWSYAQREGRGTVPPFGAFCAADDHAPYRSTPAANSGWTTTQTGTILGEALTVTGVAGSGSGQSSYLFDASLLGGDDFANEVDVEFWAHFVADSTMQVASVGPNIILYADAAQTAPSGVQPTQRYTREYGIGGYALRNLPSTLTAKGRMTRLGTITLPTQGYWRVTLFANWPASVTGAFTLDYLVAVPARQRAASPTALPAGFPSLLPISFTYRFPHAIFRNDGSGAIKTGLQDPGIASTGLGSIVEVAPGNIDALFFESIIQADDPNQSSTSDNTRVSCAVHAAVWPRYYWARGV